MDFTIQLTSNSINDGSLTLNPDLAKSFGITGSTSKRIRFGSKSDQINVHLSNDLQQNEASLSAAIMDKLGIPPSCSLEIKQTGNEILIGPFIGLLASYYQSSIKKNLHHLLDYLFHYREIKGAVIVFSLDTVDKINYTVKGFLYNPRTKQWEEGTFPYPSAIFVMTSSVSSAWIQHFQSIIGDTIFNDLHLNRWSIHKKFAASIGMKNYLPESVLYRSPQDLYLFLEKFPNVTVKSINTTDFSHMKVILKDMNNLVFSNPKESVTKNIKYSSRDQAYSIFSRYFKNGEYMIQESIDVTGYRTIDFRIIIVKNQYGQWQAMGTFTRDRELGDRSRNLYPLISFGRDTIKELLQKSDLYASLVFQEIIHIGIDAVKALESTGVHFANAAVDMTIGEIGDIWISDIDHCHPSHDIALVAGYPEQYYEILKTNMLYARKLAGF